MTDIKEWSGVAELRIMMRCSMSIMKCRMFFGALWVNILLISKVVCDFAQDEINREVKSELSPQSIKSTNMLHLDVKPSNIMLEANGNIVLFDIGTSKVFDTPVPDS